MQEHLKRTRRVEARRWLLVLISFGLMGMAACSPSLGRFGEACNVYAQYPAKCPPGTLCSGDCTQGLQCSCAPGGCFCSSACGSVDGGTSCPGSTVCRLGRNPVEANTGYYCFPPDGGV